jgi:hypothetical protein
MNLILLAVTLAFILATFLLSRTAARHPEGVMNTLAILGLAALLGALGFSVIHSEAAGPLIIGVQFAGFAALVLMLWRHWTEGPLSRRR